MKQNYLKGLPVDIGNYKNEAAILMHIHNAAQLRFPGITYFAKTKADKQPAKHKHNEDMIMLDIFGALNY